LFFKLVDLPYHQYVNNDTNRQQQDYKPYGKPFNAH